MRATPYQGNRRSTGRPDNVCSMATYTTLELVFEKLSLCASPAIVDVMLAHMENKNQ